MIAIGTITIYTSYGDYEKIASGYIAAYSHRHFADDCTCIILETMKEKYLFLKPAKCSFDKEEIDFLGMIIKHGKVAMDPAKLKGITEWSTPQKLQDVRTFIGFCNFYRQFIPRFSDLACPLVDLTKKDIPFIWS